MPPLKTHGVSPAAGNQEAYLAEALTTRTVWSLVAAKPRGSRGAWRPAHQTGLQPLDRKASARRESSRAVLAARPGDCGRQPHTWAGGIPSSGFSRTPWSALFSVELLPPPSPGLSLAPAFSRWLLPEQQRSATLSLGPSAFSAPLRANHSPGPRQPTIAGWCNCQPPAC